MKSPHPGVRFLSVKYLAGMTLLRRICSSEKRTLLSYLSSRALANTLGTRGENMGLMIAAARAVRAGVRPRSLTPARVL